MNLKELQICLTTKCNNNCSYCHLDRKTSIFLSLDNIHKVIEIILNNKISAVRLTGGDIFLYPDLKVVLQLFRQNNIKIILNISVFQITKVPEIIDLADIVLFSFTNLNQISENKDLLNNISKKVDIMGCMVFESFKLTDLKELFLQRNEITFSDFFFLRDVCNETTSYFNDLNLLIYKLSYFNSIFLKKNKKPILFSNSFPLCFLKKKDVSFCSGKQFDNGYSRLYVDANGNYKPSAYSDIILGNLDDSLSDLYDKNLLENTKIINTSICKNCSLNTFCGGGITANKKYSEDIFLKYVYYNKYLTSFQDSFLKTPYIINLNNLFELYHEKSGFYMNYPSPDFWIKTQKDQTSVFNTKENINYNLYIHFPFCMGECSFCKIPKLNNSLKEKYLCDLESNLSLLCNFLKNNLIETIYFGGGSPQLMGLDGAKRILPLIFNSLKNYPTEVTFELFPKNFDYDLMLFLKKYVNRLSIGLQCFDDEKLLSLNRKVTVLEMLDFVNKCKKLGFEIINFDLIYGLYEDEIKFKKDLDLITSLNPAQITFQPLHYGIALGLTNYAKQIDLNKIGRNILLKKGFLQNDSENYYKDLPFTYQNNLLNGKNILGVGGSSFSFIDNTYFKKENEDNYYFILSKTNLLFWKLFLQSRLLCINYKKLNSEFEIDFLVEFSESLNFLIRNNLISIEKDVIHITLDGKKYVDMIANILSINNLNYKLNRLDYNYGGFE